MLIIEIVHRVCQRWVFGGLGLFFIAVTIWGFVDLIHKASDTTWRFGYDSLAMQLADTVIYGLWSLAFFVMAELADKIRYYVTCWLFEK